MQLDQVYSAADLPESDGGFDPIPAGWYSATIAGAELKTTKAGDGRYIAVKYTIAGPTHQGRVIFGNLNIRNPNEVAEKIGLQQFGDLLRAIGVPRVSDTDQLIGGSLQIKLAIKPAQNGYEASNEVKAFKAVGGGGGAGGGVIPQAAATRPTAFGSAAQKPADSPAPASPASPPWARK
jgi:hypothetical protein